MSSKTKLLRSIYGVEQRPKIARSKHAFYAEEEAKRGDVRRRSERRFDAALEKREARNTQRLELQ